MKTSYSSSDFDTVFCDSTEALRRAFDEGLSKYVKIKTSSPALLWRNDLNVENVEARWSRDEVRTFHQETAQYTTDLYDAISRAHNFSDYAISISRLAINFERVIYKAACLRETDFYKPRLFLSIKSDEVKLNSPWTELLSSNSQFVESSIDEDCRVYVDTKNPANFWDRLKLGGIETLFYRLAVNFWKKAPKFFAKKQLLIVKENLLILDGASQLAKKGIAIEQLNLSMPNTALPSSCNFEELFKIIKPIILKRITPWLVSEAVNPCIEMFLAQVISSVEKQDYARMQWKDIFTRVTNKKKTIVLCNSPHRPVHIALAQECHQRNIPFIGAQHGVTIEIFEDYDFQKFLHEVNIADIFLTYNDGMSKVTKSNLTKRGKSIAVGMPKRYFKTVNLRKRLSQFNCPIVFVSTNLYMGNIGFVVNYINDEEKSYQEAEYLKVFNSIPHKVMYKTYPTFNRRYSDIDPVFKLASQMNNITIFEKLTDMRYLLSAFRVIITTQATSTLSWALLSGKPLIFIDNPDLMPLRKNVYSLMKKGVFLFDRRDVDMLSKLKVFLSTSIKDIEYEWNKEYRVTARKLLLKKYFTKYNDGSAGKRVADILIDTYRSMN
jgi:hypothetical protein